MKSVTLYVPGQYKFVFSLKSQGGGGQSYACIGRNTVLVGIIRTTATGATPYTTFTEEIPGWSKGDVAGLYGSHDSANSNLRVAGFHIYASYQQLPDPIPSTTGTDADNAG